MESTLLTSFLKASKIKRWMANPDGLPLVREIKSLYDKIYSPNDADGVSTAHADELDNNADADAPALLSVTNIPHELKPLISGVGIKIRLHARFKRNGIIFSVSKTHRGNSQIYYYPGGDKTLPPLPGAIKYIFTESGSPYIFAAIQHIDPVGEFVDDPFARYPYWPAKLYKSLRRESYERIQSDWICGHYAQWDYNSNYVVVLSLSRVCDLSVSESNILIFPVRINTRPRLLIIKLLLGLILCPDVHLSDLL